MSAFDDGDIDFEFESDGGYGDEIEETDELTVAIENSFYEAEDNKLSSPDLAIAQFLRVIELDSKRADSQSSVNWTFKALLNVVVTCARLSRLQNLLTQVTRNEASEAIDQVLDALGGRRGGFESDLRHSELSHLERVYAMTLTSLMSGGYQKLWFDTSLKLANLYIQQHNVNALKKTVKELYAVCAPNADPTGIRSNVRKTATTTTSLQSTMDISGQNTNLFELYALDAQLCLMTKDSDRMRRVYPKTLQMAASITDPRTVAVVRESGGLMYLEDKKWDAAYSEFFEAFKNYQEVGSTIRAKKALKFVVVSNLLSLSEINPFHSREATVYQDDPEIAAVHQLRLAFDSKNTEEIGQLLTDPKNPLLQDATITPYITDLLRNIRLQLVQQTLTPYTSIKLFQLAKTLSISEAELMPLVIKLILDRKIDAEIDGQKNMLKVHSTFHFGFCSAGTKNLQTETSKNQIVMAGPKSTYTEFTPACEAMFTEYGEVFKMFRDLFQRSEFIESFGMQAAPRSERSWCTGYLYSQTRRHGATSV